MIGNAAAEAHPGMDYDIVGDTEISFSDEPVGLVVVFETGEMAEDEADKIANEIAERIGAHSKKPVTVIPVS